MRINLIFLLILSNVFCNIFLLNSEKVLDTRLLALRGLCYEDLNGNALYDEGEPGFPGVRISLPIDDTNYLNHTYPNKTSGPDGFFLYDGMIQRSTYDFFFINPAGYLFETYDKKLQCPPGKQCIIPTTPSDGLVAQILIENTYAYNIPLIKRKDFPAGNSLLTVRIVVDFGYYDVVPLPSALIGSVFIDTNGDGIQDPTEITVPQGISYGLYDINTGDRVLDIDNKTLPFSVTDSGGRFKFDHLPDGNYCIKAEGTVKYGDDCIGQFVILNKNLVVSTPEDGVTSKSIRRSAPIGTVPTGVAMSGQIYLDQNKNGVNDNGETYTSGVQASLYISSTNTIKATDVDGNPIPPFTTDSAGRYKFDSLPNGTYCIRVDSADFSQGCIGVLSTNDASKLSPSTPLDSVLSPVIIHNNPLGVTPAFTGSAISGSLFSDTNGNGIQDGTEKGTSGISVGVYNKDGTRALDAFGKPIPSTTTDANGKYKFENLPDGQYCIRADSTSYDQTCTLITIGKGTSSQSVPSDGVKSSTIIRNPPTVLAPAFTGSAISGSLFSDTNGNGIQDGTEKGISGISVGVYNKDGTRALDAFGKPIPSTTTDANGKYNFENLPDGQYCIHADSTSYDQTCTLITVNKGTSSPSTPSDGVKSPTIIRNPPTVLAPAFTGSAISGSLFSDTNGNGIQDGTEKGTSGISVGVYNNDGTRALDAFGKPIPSTTTDANGKYKFENLPDGQYCIRADSTSYDQTCTLVTVNKGTASPSTPSDGVKSPTIIRNPPTVLAPAFTGSAISGSLFNDTNGNGIQDGSEKGASGIPVGVYNKDGTRALDAFGKPIPSTTTDANGKYNFENLPDGQYCIRVENASYDQTCTLITVNKGTASPSTPSDGVKSPTIIRNPPTVLAPAFTGSAISGPLFNDANGNGIQDGTEKATPGIVAGLYYLNNQSRVVDNFGKLVPLSTTDANGRYKFENLPNGQYCIKVEGGGDNQDCIGKLTVDKNTLPPSTPADGVKSSTILRTPPMGVPPIATGSAIVGPLFIDTNGNGYLDGSEVVATNVQAGLYLLGNKSRAVDSNGNQIPLSTTDSSGRFKFENVPDGEYCIRVTGSQSFDSDKCTGRLTIDKSNSKPSVTSDGVKSPTILKTSPMAVPLATTGSAISGPLFIDTNGNGIQDGSETIAPQGIVSTLYFQGNKSRAVDKDGKLVPPSSTDSTGRYKFDNIPDGQYCIRISGEYFDGDKCIGNFNIDKTKLPSSTPSDNVQSPVISRNPSMATPPAAIGGAISGPLFNDANGNGILDGSEKATPGIVAGLYYLNNQSRVVDNFGKLVPLSTTDANGKFKFDNLPDGQYCILIEGGGANQDCIGKLTVDKNTLPKSTQADGVKSPTILRTQPMAVPPPAIGSAITGSLFKDENGNGIQDGSEQSSQGLSLGIYFIGNKSRAVDSNGQLVSLSITGPGGAYKFDNLPDGEYCLKIEGGGSNGVNPDCFGQIVVVKNNLPTPSSSEHVKSSVILRVPPLSTVKSTTGSAMTGQVYVDSNKNDIVDNGELSVNIRAGIYISGTNSRAVDKDGIVIPFSITDSLGRYKFDNIPDGEYCIRVVGQDLNLDCVGKFFIDKTDLPPSNSTDGVKAPTILRNSPLDIQAPPTGSAMTGLLYTDSNGNGIYDRGEPINGNVRIGIYHYSDKSTAEDIYGNPAPYVFTDSKGYYKFDNIPNGQYCIRIDGGSQSSLYNQDCIGRFSIDKSVLPESYQSDDVVAPVILRNQPLNTAPPTTGSAISGSLYVDSNKSGYLDRGEQKANVRVSLYVFGNASTKAVDKDGKVVQPSITDSNGRYIFDNIPNGDYCIRVEGTDFNQDCIGKFSVDKTKLPPSYPSDGVGSAVISRNDPIDISPPISGSALAGPIYPDTNGNGFIDQDEKPISNVRTGLYYYSNKTRALDKDGQVVPLSITGADGKYKFENLPDGTYCIKVEGSGSQFDKDCVGKFEISKENLSPSYPSDNVKSPVILRAQPLNVLPPKVTTALTGLLFRDDNGNGVMDLPSEKSGESIPVTIYNIANKTRALDSNGQLIPISYTDSNGKYKFDNLLDGQYCIRVAGQQFDKSCIGIFDINHLTNKSPESTPADQVSAPFILNAPPLNILPQFDGSAVVGSIYKDAIGDGSIDSYAQNVKVGLYFLGNKTRAVDSFGDQVSLSITGSDGKYKFDNIPNGQYCLKFESDKFFDGGCVDQIDVNNRVLQKPVPADGVRAPTILHNEPIGLVPIGDKGVKGVVFNDRDLEGIRSINEQGISNVQVKLYLQNGVLFSTVTTNSQGQWSISGLTQDYLVRVEFTIPDEYVSTGGKSVHFVKAGQTSDINLGLILKSSLGNGIAGIENPTGFTTTCFTKGLYNGKNAGEPAVVDLAKDAQGKSSENGNVGFTKVLARHRDVGSVHGITYNPITTDRYVASYHKVGSDFGPAGSCAIYRITSTGVTSVYANLNDIFGKSYCGEYSHNFAVNEIGVAGPMVGKVSLGQLSYFNNKLYVTNLAKNEILIIPTDAVPTFANIQRITVGNPGCYNQDRSSNPLDWHVFSVTVHKGEIYAGGVCSGETGSRVSAYIVKYNGIFKSFSTILNFNLNHARGCRTLDINANCVSALNEKWSQKDTSQAILSSILFESGKLYMAFKDRSGDIASLYPSPELLVACIGADGKYYLENGGKCGTFIGSGVNQKSLDDSPYGPGYGNFFELRKENYHDYTGAFGIAKAGANQIVTTGFDAFDEFEGSVRWYNTSNGSTNRAFSLYSSPTNAYAPFNAQRTTVNATKSGLGDIATVYDKLAYQYRIGRIWSDTNGNGIADAYEKGISGIKVYLINGDETDPVAETTTDSNGNFKFEVDYSKEYYVATRMADFPPGSDVTIPNADPSRPQTNSDASTFDNAFVAYFKSHSTGGYYFNGVNFGIIKK